MAMFGSDRGAWPHWFRAGRDGIGFGGGVYRDEFGEFLTASENIGAWDTPQGNRKYGFETTVNGLKYNGGTGVDVDIATFNQGITDDGSTFQMGGQLNGGAIALSGSEPDPHRDDDRSVRAGWSGGMGGALRVHHGDEDGDGHGEYGVGVDVGPVSLDYKTEDLKELALLPAIGPAGLLLTGALDLADDSEHERQVAQPTIADTGANVADAMEPYVPDVEDVEEYVPEEVIEVASDVEEAVEEYAPTPSNVYSWLTDDD